MEEGKESYTSGGRVLLPGEPQEGPGKQLYEGGKQVFPKDQSSVLGSHC